MSNWNPLYPSNLDVDPLEEAAREAEWEDSMKDPLGDAALPLARKRARRESTEE